MDEALPLSERRRRLGYAVVALLFGLPGAVCGGVVAAYGLLVVGYLLVEEGARSGYLSMAAVLLWGLCGVLGVVAWLRLSVAFLRGGAVALRAIRSGWWYLLSTGVLAALVVLALTLYAWTGYWGWVSRSANLLPFLLLGPSLLPPTAMLCWFRRAPVAR